MARSITRAFGKLLMVAGSLLLVAPLHAGEFIGGVKLGVVDPQVPNFDPTTTATLQLGYEFLDLAAVDLAVEGEVTRSITDGDGPGGDYSYQHAGVYGSLRTAGPVYVLARAGLIDVRLEPASGSDSDSGIAYGLGIGFSTGIRWEIEWTTYEFEDDDVQHVSFQLSF